MKVLIADDSEVFRGLFEMVLQDWGFDLTMCENGAQAWEELQKNDGPRLALLDWMMPEMTGIQVCKKVREELDRPEYVYLILVTTRSDTDDLAKGFEMGADDYLVKPFEESELRARLRAGLRIVQLKSEVDYLLELKEARDHIRHLQELLPMCMHCGKVRGTTQSTQVLHTYFEKYSAGRQISHCLCDDCMKRNYPVE